MRGFLSRKTSVAKKVITRANVIASLESMEDVIDKEALRVYSIVAYIEYLTGRVFCLKDVSLYSLEDNVLERLLIIVKRLRGTTAGIVKFNRNIRNVKLLKSKGVYIKDTSDRVEVKAIYKHMDEKEEIDLLRGKLRNLDDRDREYLKYGQRELLVAKHMKELFGLEEVDFLRTVGMVSEEYFTFLLVS